jgi:hypothetical protein
VLSTQARNLHPVLFNQFQHAQNPSSPVSVSPSLLLHPQGIESSRGSEMVKSEPNRNARMVNGFHCGVTDNGLHKGTLHQNWQLISNAMRRSIGPACGTNWEQHERYADTIPIEDARQYYHWDDSNHERTRTTNPQ